MKRLIFHLVFLLFFVGTGLAKDRIGVFIRDVEFKNVPGQGAKKYKALGQVLAGQIQQVIGESPEYQVYTLDDFTAYLQDRMNIQRETCVADDKCIRKLMTNRGASDLVSSWVTLIDRRYYIKLTHFHSGDVVKSLNGHCPVSDNALSASLRALAGELFSITSPQVIVRNGQVVSGVHIPTGEKIVNKITDKTGFLIINTSPSGATIVLNNEEIGHAPLQLDQMIGRYVIKATLGKLYHPSWQEVQLTPKGATVTLTLQPAFGAVSVISDPEGAKIWLNGEQTGITPLHLNKKPSGNYTLRITKEHYLDYQATIVVRDGKTTSVNRHLKQNWGSLHIESAPPGAWVFLNNKRTGTVTPVTFNVMQPSVYVIRLHREGYGDKIVKAVVKNKQEASYKVTLQPKLGLLSVMTSYEDGTPCQGDIYVDGKLKGRTPWKGDVLAVTHHIRVQCPKGNTSENVRILHNQTKRLKLVISTGQWNAEHRPVVRQRPHRSVSHRPSRETHHTDIPEFVWNKRKPIEFIGQLGAGMNYVPKGGPTHNLKFGLYFPVQAGVLLGGRWRLSGLFEYSMMWNSKSTKDTPSSLLQSVIDTGIATGIQLGPVGIDIVNAFEYSGETCAQWTSSDCMYTRPSAKGYLVGLRISLHVLIFVGFSLRADYSTVNGAVLGGSFSLGGPPMIESGKRHRR